MRWAFRQFYLQIFILLLGDKPIRNSILPRSLGRTFLEADNELKGAEAERAADILLDGVLEKLVVNRAGLIWRNVVPELVGLCKKCRGLRTVEEVAAIVRSEIDQSRR